jgi:hypothetical protein
MLVELLLIWLVGIPAAVVAGASLGARLREHAAAAESRARGGLRPDPLGNVLQFRSRV